MCLYEFGLNRDLSFTTVGRILTRQFKMKGTQKKEESRDKSDRCLL